MAVEELVLRTTPSTFIAWPVRYRTPLPYQRVVGTEYDNEVLWLDPNKIEGDIDAGYDQAEARVMSLEVPTEFALRAVDFFRTYLSRGNVAVDSYNCHRFGYWMSGSPRCHQSPTVEVPNDFVLTGQEVEAPLPVGIHGVIGKKIRPDGFEPAIHSIVGIDDPKRCLQVIAVGGYMAVDTYRNVFRHYRCKTNGYSRLYTAQPDDSQPYPQAA